MISDLPTIPKNIPVKWRALYSQMRAELVMTLRRGESIILTIGIPIAILIFFSTVKVLPTGETSPIAFLTLGVLALAIMSTSMVSLGISTGFERSNGVLKRLGSTPLGRPSLLAAKIQAILVIEILQVVLLSIVGLALGWQLKTEGGIIVGVALALLATTAFSGIGLALAGTLSAETNLAAANGLYLVLLLLGGMVIPLSSLPSGLRIFSELLPAASLSQGLHYALGTSSAVPLHDWIVLAFWALTAPTVAAMSFKFE